MRGLNSITVIECAQRIQLNPLVWDPGSDRQDLSIYADRQGPCRSRSLSISTRILSISKGMVLTTTVNCKFSKCSDGAPNLVGTAASTVVDISNFSLFLSAIFTATSSERNTAWSLLPKPPTRCVYNKVKFFCAFLWCVRRKEWCGEKHLRHDSLPGFRLLTFRIFEIWCIENSKFMIFQIQHFSCTKIFYWK